MSMTASYASACTAVTNARSLVRHTESSCCRFIGRPAQYSDFPSRNSSMDTIPGWEISHHLAPTLEDIFCAENRYGLEAFTVSGTGYVYWRCSEHGESLLRSKGEFCRNQCHGTVKL